MNDFFNDKVVWITGASSGIGEALAYEFSSRGAKLILSARNESALESVRKNCKVAKDKIFVLPLDLSVTSKIEEKACLAVKKWARIDYMIHNAGIASRDFVQNTDLQVYRSLMETNFFGTVAVTKSILPSMMELKKGHLVVISSLSGKYGVPKLSAYSASKHALHGFFDSLRGELIPFKINVSIIIPGFINTQIVKNAVDGTGKPIGKNMSVNEQGMPAETCAVKIIKAIEHNKHEALIGGSEMYSVYMHRFFPQLLSGIISNHPVKRLRKFFPFLFKSTGRK